LCCVWLAALLTTVLSAGVALAAAPPEAMGCYVSTGDNDWLWDSPPVQSAADIEAVFDSLQRVFGVQRIYWRGLQTELVLDTWVVRPENLLLAQFYDWERYLTREVGVSRLAVEEAHRRGMTIWG